MSKCYDNPDYDDLNNDIQNTWKSENLGYKTKMGIEVKDEMVRATMIPKEYFGEEETLEDFAEKWVFETNGHKWSNNDDTAGDNYGSFIAGFKLAQERGYSGEEVEDIVNKTVNKFCTFFSDELKQKVSKEWFEKFKKK